MLSNILNVSTSLVKNIKLIPLEGITTDDGKLNLIQSQITNLQDNNFVPQKGLVDQMKDLGTNIKNLNDSILSIGKTIAVIHYYMTHPGALAWLMWSGLVKYSVPIFAVITMVGLIMFICGVKRKGATISKISFFIFIAVKIFDKLMRV